MLYTIDDKSLFQTASPIPDHTKDFLHTMQKAVDDAGYTTPYASLYCPFDETMHQQVHARAHQIGRLDFCVVIGIGGSSLGFRAVYDALQDQATLKPSQVMILETVDTPSVKAAILALNTALDKNRRVHVCIISKSGTTTETIALWRIVEPVLRHYNGTTWHQHVTIITDAHSPLEQYARAQSIATLTVPRLVGGRYSVLSPVGLFPLALCGIDITQLCAGARDAITHTLTGTNSMPIDHASCIYAMYQKNYPVHDTFIFSTWCGAIGLWYRQLAAESLGKMRGDGSLFSMIPTVSIGSTDLHSIGQLYLSGTQNFWTTFITISEHTSLNTGRDDALDRYVPSFNNRSLTEIMDAIVQGTLQAYHECHVPCTHVNLPERSPYTISYLMQSYILAIMYTGTLLAINPFDQPNVERYKKITRKLLQ